MRSVFGIIGGLVTGIIVIVFVGIVGVGATFSAPSGLDPSNAQQVVEAFGNASVGVHLAMMAAWLGGGLVGAFVGKTISHSGLIAWIVAGLIAVYVLLNVLILPLPAWVQGLWIAAPLIGGLIGNHLAKDAPAPADEPLEDAPPEA